MASEVNRRTFEFRRCLIFSFAGSSAALDPRLDAVVTLGTFKLTEAGEVQGSFCLKNPGSWAQIGGDGAVFWCFEHYYHRFGPMSQNPERPRTHIRRQPPDATPGHADRSRPHRCPGWPAPRPCYVGHRAA